MNLALMAAIVAAGFAAWLTRGPAWRRGAAALIPIAVGLLTAPPLVPWPGYPSAALDDDATLADIESVTATGGPITVSGNGPHWDLAALLTGHAVTWQRPASHLGLVRLAWPRRVALGEPIAVRGALDTDDSVLVRWIGPDGVADSLRTDSAFTFAVTPRAVGRWTIGLEVAGDALQLGVQVRPPPRLRVLVIAGRPDFEVPALVRRLAAQGAGITVRTRLTRDAWRTEQSGPAAPATTLADTTLDALDLLVLAAGGGALLSAQEQRRVADAVERGLGVLHLADAPISAGPLVPFPVRARGSERTTALLLDGERLPGPAKVAAVVAEEATAYLTDSSGAPIAWRSARGRGVVAVSAFVSAHRLALAGHPESEAAWWAALVGPVLRPTAGRWDIAADALVRVDDPFSVRWHGPRLATAIVGEGGEVAPTRLIHEAADSQLSLRLWPRDSGWLTVAGGGDTLELLVAPRSSFPGIDRALRREAMDAIDRVAARADGPPRVPLPRWLAWTLLLAAVTVAWRPR